MKIAIITFLVLMSGVVALNLLGKSYIPEITQESIVTGPSGITNTVDMAEPAPFFELLDVTGDKVKSSDFLGSPVVFTFWTTWNPASADQIKIFDDYVRRGDENLVKIVTISSQEDKSIVVNFITRGEYMVKVLLDESGAITEAYQARNLPAT